MGPRLAPREQWGRVSLLTERSGDSPRSTHGHGLASGHAALDVCVLRQRVPAGGDAARDVPDLRRRPAVASGQRAQLDPARRDRRQRADRPRTGARSDRAVGAALRRDRAACPVRHDSRREHPLGTAGFPRGVARRLAGAARGGRRHRREPSASGGRERLAQSSLRSSSGVLQRLRPAMGHPPRPRRALLVGHHRSPRRGATRPVRRSFPRQRGATPPRRRRRQGRGADRRHHQGRDAARHGDLHAQLSEHDPAVTAARPPDRRSGERTPVRPALRRVRCRRGRERPRRGGQFGAALHRLGHRLDRRSRDPHAPAQGETGQASG